MSKKFDIQAHVKSGKVLEKAHRDSPFHRFPAPLIECEDGFTMSVQASGFFHYCEPRNDDGPYTHFEVGFPSEYEDKLMPYAEDEERPTETVYACVPLEIVEHIIKKHGGVRWSR